MKVQRQVEVTDTADVRLLRPKTRAQGPKSALAKHLKKHVYMCIRKHPEIPDKPGFDKRMAGDASFLPLLQSGNEQARIVARLKKSYSPDLI